MRLHFSVKSGIFFITHCFFPSETPIVFEQTLSFRALKTWAPRNWWIQYRFAYFFAPTFELSNIFHWFAKWGWGAVCIQCIQCIALTSEEYGDLKKLPRLPISLGFILSMNFPCLSGPIYRKHTVH